MDRDAAYELYVKGPLPSVRLAVSRASANASVRTLSKDSPWRTRSFNFSLSARIFSVSRALIFSSSALIAPTCSKSGASECF